MYYDRSGAPIEMLSWASKIESESYKVVSQTHVGEVLVSTVWLGIDHQFGDGPPLIFETMVFGGPLDSEQDRYPTEVAALAGHDQMVARVREGRAP